MTFPSTQIACVALFIAGCGLAPLDGEDDLASQSARGNYLDISHDTFLKRSPAASSQLGWGSGKCRLFASARIESATAPVIADDHFVIDMTTHIPGCEFTRGYVWSGHVSDASSGTTGDDSLPPPPSPGAGSCHANISTRECALLSTIAYAEGTRERYNIIFSFATFSSYADHPRRVLCSGGYCSDAAGRYQFLSTTWDWVAGQLGLGDFSPASQDIAGLWLVRNRGVYDVNGIDTFGEFESAMYKLNREWASLPGSPYGQPTHDAWSLWLEYRHHAGLN